MNHGTRHSRRSGRYYPDASNLDVLDELLSKGSELEQEQVSQQRDLLQRIQSERFIRNLRRAPHVPVTLVARSASSRSLPSARFMARERPPVFLAQASFKTDETSACSTQSATVSSTETPDRNHWTDSGGPQTNPPAPHTVPSLGRASSSPYAETSHALDDRVGHFPSGKRVNIKGASHVYTEIQKGNAVIVQCPICNTFSQVGKQTVNVLCPMCKTVSPVSATLSTVNTTEMDNEIASAVQRQECDVVRARLQAKLHNAGGNAAL